MKKIIYTGMTALALLFTGCGSDSDEASCRFTVQQNLDTGDFAAVIAELSNPSSACLATYTANDWQIDLGAAYMGQAGLGVSDIVALITANDGTDIDPFATLIDSVSAQQNDSSLINLENASNAYTAGLVGTLCTDPAITDTQQDICLFIGLAETMLATTTVSFLVDDIAVLFDDTNITAQDVAKEEMTAAMCALQFINQGTTCADATSVTATDVPFTYTDVNNTVKTFSNITVTMAAAPNNVYHELGTAVAVIPGTTVVTDGYCDNDFSGASPTWDVTLSPYACPLNQDPLVEDQNITTLLVNTLNNGLDAISGAIADPEIQNDIDAYLADINTDANTTISIEEIQAYLNTL